MNKYDRLLVSILLMGSLFSFFSCRGGEEDNAYRLNELAYKEHYRSLDRVKLYADSVLSSEEYSDDSKAEAMNNLAFYYIGKMKYRTADSLLNEVYALTDNHIELLISSIQQMRICQQQSKNKEYYEYRQRALRHIARIHEEERFNSHQKRRLYYAETEFLLASSVYSYYVGQTDEAKTMISKLDSLTELRNDTIQYLAYLYNVGSGGIITTGSRDEIAQQEIAYLIRCYLISTEKGYIYWQANAMQALSEHLMSAGVSIMDNNRAAIHYINTEQVPDSLLAGNLAFRARELFAAHGDTYQQAAAWRTLAECYWQLNDYSGAVYALDKAMKVDTLIEQSPALMATIHERYSLAFSALDDKPRSDYHRNLYLDLYEKARQDKLYEARAEELDNSLFFVNWMLFLIGIVIVCLIVLLVILIYKRRTAGKNSEQRMIRAVQRWKQEHTQMMQNLDADLEECQENCAMQELQLSRQQENYVENKAKIHLVNSLLPLVNRMIHELRCLQRKQESDAVKDERRLYVSELIAKINSTNDFLTHWIQLKRGELTIKVESFELQSLFDIIARNTASYARKNLKLSIEETSLVVKADRALTLFMINTICDNARKYTSEGGEIRLSAKEEGDMVAVTIADNGIGMTQEQCDHLFDIKSISDERLSAGGDKKGKSHGFGLLNCKGIIEKYKKTNSLFANCTLDISSKEGSGTAFRFTLPKGIRKTIAVLCVLMAGVNANAADYHALADSVYQCNIEGRYAESIIFAEKCFHELNAVYHSKYQNGSDTLMIIDPILSTAAESRWFTDYQLDVPYPMILSVRNEVAVAALALHQWDVYHYNNSAYSQLFKEYYADRSLADYCESMQLTETNSVIAMTILILLLLSFVPIYYFLYYRHVLTDVKDTINDLQHEMEEKQQEVQVQRYVFKRLSFENERLHVNNNILDNSLSTIKHETMYYPSRISQMLNMDEDIDEISGVAEYYQTLCEVLSEQTQHNSLYQLPPDVLRKMLVRCLAKISGQRVADVSASAHQDKCDIYELKITKDDEVLKLIINQIVRDLGEIFGQRRSGVIEKEGMIRVTIPSFV